MSILEVDAPEVVLTTVPLPAVNRHSNIQALSKRDVRLLSATLFNL